MYAVFVHETNICIQMKYCLQSIYNFMIERAGSIPSLLYSMLRVCREVDNFRKDGEGGGRICVQGNQRNMEINRRLENCLLLQTLKNYIEYINRTLGIFVSLKLMEKVGILTIWLIFFI